MALRIGFDLDGVFADMESALVRQAEILFGERATGVPRKAIRNPAKHRRRLKQRTRRPNRAVQRRSSRLRWPGST